jgi:hypothetical protein
MLNFDKYWLQNSITLSPTLLIDTAKYGIDYRIQCIIGFNYINYRYISTPFHLYDLGPNGV